MHPANDRPVWVPSRRRLEWRTGVVAQAFSSEDPEALRGPQFAAAWSDGKPFNLANANYRLHRGTENQEPDSLIEAKQGNDRAPGYRGTAYVVFERLPLGKFGNRVPHFSFEVIRPVGRLEKMVRSVTMIPGATEFGYSPSKVRQIHGPGHREPLNDHTDRAATDWRVAVGELVDLCPNLESIGLVAAWFGNDLRANHCEIMPGVVSRNISTAPNPWKAGGRTRANAHLVSQYQGRAAYGGTPSDESVVAAIRDLNERGLKVMFYPFVMMDVRARQRAQRPLWRR